jgi:hypothetical protein
MLHCATLPHSSPRELLRPTLPASPEPAALPPATRRPSSCISCAPALPPLQRRPRSFSLLLLSLNPCSRLFLHAPCLALHAPCATRNRWTAELRRPKQQLPAQAPAPTPLTASSGAALDLPAPERPAPFPAPCAPPAEPAGHRNRGQSSRPRKRYEQTRPSSFSAKFDLYSASPLRVRHGIEPPPSPLSFPPLPALFHGLNCCNFG